MTEIDIYSKESKDSSKSFFSSWYFRRLHGKAFDYPTINLEHLARFVRPSLYSQVTLAKPVSEWTEKG